MTPDVAVRWEEFLTPGVLRTKLIGASLYLAAFEMLKNSIIGRIRDFYTDGFNQEGLTVDPKYRDEVLSRSTSRLYASLSWLREKGVISEEDLETFEEIKTRRNSVAHELTNIIAGATTLDFIETFPKLVALLRKIEVWWIVNVEIPTNPDFDDATVDESGIIPGSIITVQIMLSVALGTDGKAEQYLEAFQKAQE